MAAATSHDICIYGQKVADLLPDEHALLMASMGLPHDTPTESQERHLELALQDITDAGHQVMQSKDPMPVRVALLHCTSQNICLFRNLTPQPCQLPHQTVPVSLQAAGADLGPLQAMGSPATEREESCTAAAGNGRRTSGSSGSAACLCFRRSQSRHMPASAGDCAPSPA